jgi:hypothetical protein
MSLDITRLMNNARVHLPGAIDTNLQLELFNTLSEFFESSNIWQEEVPFRVNTTTVAYPIEQEAVATINRLLSVTNSDGVPVAATMAIPGELILGALPNQLGAYTATISLTVNDPVQRDGYPEYPPWTLTKYGMGILDGLLARMMAQPAKPYTNAQMSIFHMRKFNGVVSQAKFEALHKNVNNGQAWRFPQSFATTRRR